MDVRSFGQVFTYLKDRSFAIRGPVSVSMAKSLDPIIISSLQITRSTNGVEPKRQWGLIHIEQQWAENEATAHGQILHQKADDPYIKEKRKDIITSRAMHVSSKTLGLYGILDVVEFHKDENAGYPITSNNHLLHKPYYSPSIISTCNPLASYSANFS